MYRALKSAQTDIHDVLLKFTDEIIQVVESKASSAVDRPSDDHQFHSLQEQMNVLSNNQVSQFNQMTHLIQRLNRTMSNILTVLVSQKENDAKGCCAVEGSCAVQTSQTIPSIQPTASNADLQNVGADIHPVSDTIEYEEVDAESEILANESDALDQEVDVEEELEEEVEEELEEEVDEELEGQLEEEVEEEVEEEQLEEEVEEEVEEEQLEEEVEEEEDLLEVEEWVYKGNMYFKDSDETVYMNDDGEVGDAFGRYDPIKKIIKKLSTK